MVCSVSSMKLSDDTAEYFVVGTAFVLPGELEPTKGRIHLFQVHNGKLQLISQKETRGAVYNVNPFHGKLLAGINSRVQLYKWEQQDDGSRQLVPDCSHAGHTLALHIDVRGDFILIGEFCRLYLISFHCTRSCCPDAHMCHILCRRFDEVNAIASVQARRE